MYSRYIKDMKRRIFHYKYELILFIVTGLLLFSGLDKIEVNIMEARNFITAREMVQNNEYLLTTLNGEPRYQKPPLPTWLTALAGSIFGFDSLFALRVPVVLITFLLVFTFFFFSKELGLSTKHSFYNSVILITSFYIFFAGRDNQWDMYTHSFMFVSIYFLWKVLKENKNLLLNSMLSGIFLGFSILSKGPVSFYALFLPFLFSYIINYRTTLKGKGIYLLQMVLLGLVIGLSWFIYVRLNDSEYFRIIATREISNWNNYEVKPFYYYWNFFIQSGLWTVPSLISLVYPYLRKRVCDLRAYRFAILWTIISVILLSAIPEKKIRYLVPALIPLALTTGFYIDYLLKSFGHGTTKSENILVYISYGIIALVGITYPFVLFFLLKEGLKDHLFIYVLSSFLILVCSFLIVKGLTRHDFGKVFRASIAIFIIIVIGALPMSGEFFTNPNYASAGKAREIEKQLKINTYRLTDIAPEIVWDFGKPIPIYPPQNNTSIPDDKRFGLIVNIEDSTRLQSIFPSHNFSKLYRINMNYRQSKKNRLIKDYYLVSAKN